MTYTNITLENCKEKDVLRLIVPCLSTVNAYGCSELRNLNSAGFSFLICTYKDGEKGEKLRDKGIECKSGLKKQR